MESRPTRHFNNTAVPVRLDPAAVFKGDSVLTNVISKIAGIKEREHHADDRRPFVLWIDLQSEGALVFDYSHQLQPLMSWNGTVASGGYWHALYGRNPAEVGPELTSCSMKDDTISR